ncbi:MAG: box helicase domain protein [Chloroflexi bacterium]|nr:box helicase domain protein [Chloroflexota bacterium]
MPDSSPENATNARFSTEDNIDGESYPSDQETFVTPFGRNYSAEAYENTDFSNDEQLNGPALVTKFKARYDFELDDFQQQAIGVLAQGDSVMVAAPTGTGKTVVAEYGIFQAYSRRKRIFYTTPVKALSNQKFKDLRAQYGDAVGLLTGDVIENPNGYIIVMTTEVLRNMLLQTPDELKHVECVVFDEIHYLADSERGTTWEESIILCPKNIQLVCLSATISNAGEVADWITNTHRPVTLITHTKRSVPLSLYYFLEGDLNLVINREGKQVADFRGVGGEAKSRFRGKGFRGNTNPDTDERSRRERPEPTQREIVEALEKAKMLPAIYFMFSRNDCEVSAEIVGMAHLERIKDPKVRHEIDEVIARYMDRMSEEDRNIQQVKTIVALARRGLGYHHAGLLSILKQLVEELFSRGLMSVVFATDTLALGVNMPAKTVVIGRMSKFDGQSRRPLLPNEFQQMAGRAGRRGLDGQGHVVVPYSPWISFNETIEIATGPLLPIESAFTVRYNSVLNLWDPPVGERVLQILRHSLLEFQQGRRLRELGGEVRSAQHAYDKAQVGCLIGYPEGEELLHEYERIGHEVMEGRDDEKRAIEDSARLKQKIEERPWRKPMRETLKTVFKSIAPGLLVHSEDHGWGIYLGRSGDTGIGLFMFGDEVVKLDEYKYIDYLPPERYSVNLPAGMANVIRPGLKISELLNDAEIASLTAQLSGFTLPDLSTWQRTARVENEQKYGPVLERALAKIEEARQSVKELKERERVHPCQRCDVRKKHRSLQREAAKLLVNLAEAQERYEERKQYEESRLQQTLNGIVTVLRKFGYLDRVGNLTEKSPWLRDVFDTNSLIIIEMVKRGWLNELPAPDLAEVFTWFSYDRDFEFMNRFVLPKHLIELRKTLDELEREIFSAERQNDLMITNGYNIYFYGATRAWCRGASLASIMEKMQLAEGDIIITFNKTLDLMRQVFDMLVEHEPGHPLIARLKEAKVLVRRGVVEQVYNIGFGVLQDALEEDGETRPTGDIGGEPTQAEIEAAPPFLRPIPDPDEDEEEEEVTEDTNGNTNSDGSPAKRKFKRRGNRPWPVHHNRR